MPWTVHACLKTNPIQPIVGFWYLDDTAVGKGVADAEADTQAVVVTP